MSYITYGERIGLQEGLLDGIAAVLDVRFGEAGKVLLSEIREISDPPVLRAILERAKTAATLDGVRAVYTPAQ